MPRGKSFDRGVPRKKTVRLHQSKIDRAMKLLGTRSETGTIECALDLVVFRETLVSGIRVMYGSGLVTVFD